VRACVCVCVHLRVVLAGVAVFVRLSAGCLLGSDACGVRW